MSDTQQTSDTGELSGAIADEQPDRDTEPIELPPPDLKTARFGTFGEIWSVWRYIKKRRKIVKKGYVEWYLIDNSFPQPKYVKPKAKGGGIPEYKHDGHSYLFPREAMVANEQNGAWTVVHKKGDAEPLNLRDPSENAIPVDVLEEYKQLIVSSSPPSLFDRFDIDAKDLFLYALVGIVVFAFIQGALGGGF